MNLIKYCILILAYPLVFLAAPAGAHQYKQLFTATESAENETPVHPLHEYRESTVVNKLGNRFLSHQRAAKFFDLFSTPLLLSTTEKIYQKLINVPIHLLHCSFRL